MLYCSEAMIHTYLHKERGRDAVCGVQLGTGEDIHANKHVRDVCDGQQLFGGDAISERERAETHTERERGREQERQTERAERKGERKKEKRKINRRE